MTRGEEVVLLARTHNDLPSDIRVTGRFGGEPFERTYQPVWDGSVAASFVPAFWAREEMTRLLGTVAEPAEVRGRVARLGIEYGLMTPYTSIISLEDDAAFAPVDAIAINRSTHAPAKRETHIARMPADCIAPPIRSTRPSKRTPGRTGTVTFADSPGWAAQSCGTAGNACRTPVRCG